MNKPLDIAVGVLVDAQGRVLIAQRRPDTPGAGYWEFPGGKREPGEPLFDCLARELAEEIGVTDLVGAPLIRFAHDRGPRPVRLHVWRIHGWTGEPGGREGQRVRWVAADALDEVELLPATDVILAALALPRRYLITPRLAESGHGDWFAALDRALAQGTRLLRLRDPDLADEDYARLAESVIERAHRHRAAVLLDRDADMVAALGADGLHWSASRIAAATRRPVGRRHWFAASAHDRDELEAALAADADFAALSPVVATATHPRARPLGWPGFESLRADRALPVYALGGLEAADQDDAIAHNAQGIAAIRGLWPETAD
ncbi:Nudix family hydrolase [Salinisphaera sp.]|uniref:Nudix family hydrolase n=1 Tax=Salinisphaera sp. TaxID=1914330 RepID=UPI002D7863BC|nr:Nudix family hydrolase [Salinisphaera sp.]HET7313169.1 Nudix family hydrolase [Salinisphaera sp.]